MVVFKELWALIKATTAEWWYDNTFRLAASLAFYTIFSLAPILLIAIYIAERIFGPGSATQQIVGEVEYLVGYHGGQAIEQIAGNVQRIEGTAWTITLGIIMLIVGATVFFAELQAALNQIWDVKSTPTRYYLLQLIRTRLVSFAMAVAVGFLLLVSLLISAALQAAKDYAGDALPEWARVWAITGGIVAFGLTMLLFALVYKVLPDAKIRWRDVWIGAMVTAALFTLGKYLIGVYLGQMAFGSTYGAAGSFVVFLIWVYYSALICFYGAEFTQVYTRRYGKRVEPVDHAERQHEKSDQSPVEEHTGEPMP